MARVRRGFKARRRRKKIMAAVRGYRGARSRTLRGAMQVLRRGLAYAYRDRRVKKREFRRLWIVKINAACRELDIKYSQFVYGLKKEGIALDRSVLADIALTDQAAFRALVQRAKSAAGL